MMRVQNEYYWREWLTDNPIAKKYEIIILAN